MIKTKAELQQQNDAVIYPNTNREITEQRLHDHVADIIDSAIKIHIPKLFLEVKKAKPINFDPSTGNIPDKLFVWWESEDKEFLNYNPQIWLFVHRKNRRKLSDKIITKRRYVHPPHQNGVNYPNSGFYSGRAENILGKPFTTEFNCPTQPFEKMELPINPYEWIYETNAGTPKEITKESVLAGNKIYRTTGTKRYGGEYNSGYRPYINFKIAIVIDNPLGGEKPKLYGPMSEKITLKMVYLTESQLYKTITYQIDRS